QLCMAFVVFLSVSILLGLFSVLVAVQAKLHLLASLRIFQILPRVFKNVRPSNNFIGGRIAELRSRGHRGFNLYNIFVDCQVNESSQRYLLELWPAAGRPVSNR